MSIARYASSLSVALLALGCCANCGAQSAPAAAQGAKVAGGPTTVAIPAHQDVATQVLLPAGTNKVRMKAGAGAFTCTNLQLVTQKGRNAKDQYMDAAEPIQIPAHMDATQSHSAPGDPYVLVYIRCKGGAADSELLIMPSS